MLLILNWQVMYFDTINDFEIVKWSVMGGNHFHLYPMIYHALGKIVRPGSTALIGGQKILMDVNNSHLLIYLKPGGQ